MRILQTTALALVLGASTAFATTTHLTHEEKPKTKNN